MATNNFDPTKYGATPFDPTQYGATPAEPEKGGFFAETPSGPSPYETGGLFTSPVTSYEPTADTSIFGSLIQGLKVSGQAIANIPTSALRLGKAAIDPRTYIGLGRAGAGGIQSIPGISNFYDAVVKTEEGKKALVENRITFQNFTEGLKDQYGSLENIKRSIAEDPIGTFVLARGLMEGGARLSQRLKGNEPKPPTPPKTTTIAPFEKTYQPEIAKEFAEAGIKPPVSAVTKSRFVRLGESFLSKTPFGQKIIQVVDDAKTAIETKTTEIVGRLKPPRTISEENLGKTIQEGIVEYENNFRKSQGKIYEEFGEKYNKSPANVDNTLETVNKIVNEQNQSLFGKIDPEVIKLRDKLNIPRKIPGGTYAEPRTGLTFENLKVTRTAIGEALARDPSNSALRRLYGALTEDMNATINKIDSSAGAELKTISESYKSGKQTIESQIAQSIEKSNPERIAQNIIKRNSAETLRTIKEIIGPERFNEISKSFLRQMFEQSETRGQFDIDKLKNNLSKYDTETLGEILTKEQKTFLDQAIVELEKLQRLKKSIKPFEKISEGSQTAYLQQVAIIPAKVSAFVAAVFTGNLALAAGVVLETLGEFVGEFGGAKLYTTGAGRQLLTEGIPFTPPNLSMPSQAFIPGKLQQRNQDIK